MTERWAEVHAPLYGFGKLALCSISRLDSPVSQLLQFVVALLPQRNRLTAPYNALFYVPHIGDGQWQAVSALVVALLAPDIQEQLLEHSVPPRANFIERNGLKLLFEYFTRLRDKH
jgi:hypothetical protein